MYINHQEDQPHGSPSKIEVLFFSSCLIYFSIKSVYFATHIRERVFPDESSWFGIIGVFSRSLLFPTDSPESYPLGLVTHVPNLYFFTMGKILPLNVLPVSDLIFLRLINVVFAVLTIVVAWRLVLMLTGNVAVRLLFMVMLTNTMMFTFISGAINYDNLVNLFAVLALFFLLRFPESKRPRDFLLFGGVVLAGTLTKVVFLPYSLALLIVCIFHRKIRKTIRQSSRISHWTRFEHALAFVCLLLIGLNLHLYAGNYLRFGHILPRMDQILSVEDSMKNRLFTRDYLVRQFKTGNIDLLTAQRLAVQIRNQGDRDFAWNMLEKAQAEQKGSNTDRLGRVKYSMEWARYIFARTYGVAAHEVISKGDDGLYPYYTVFLVAGFLAFFRFRGWGMGKYGEPLLFICGFYLIVLMQYVNYATYRDTGFIGLALTGRYIFPVLIPVYFLVAYMLMDRKPKWWQKTAGVVVSAIFILGEFPWFLSHAGENWFF